MKTAALLALALLAATPALAQPLPNDSYRGARDFNPPPVPPDKIGRLQRVVGEKERDTFAGLWVMPDQQHVAVAFTRDAAATLRKYTTDPYFIAVDRPGPSVAELNSTRDRLFEELMRLGARPDSGGADIREGTVEIHVTGDMTRFREAVAAGEVVLPDYVHIDEPPPLAEPPPLPPGPVKAFPRYRYRMANIELSVLKTGKVFLRDGCLRLKGDRHDPVAVWPNEAALEVSGDRIRVLNRATGESVNIGETIILGGNSTAVEADDVIDENPACPGPYVLIANPRPYGPFQAEMWGRRVREYAQAEKVPLAEARRILEAQARREEALKTFGEQLRQERPELFGELTTYAGKATLRLAGEPPPGLIPPDLAADITVERVPLPIATLEAARNALLDQIEAVGLKASAHSDVEAGRIVLQAEDIAALSRAAVAGKVAFPTTAPVHLITSGATPAGYFSEWNMEAAWKALEAAPDFADIQALVAATPLPFYAEAPRKPSAASAREIARYLVMLGFSAKDIRALRAEGIDPALAWVQQNGQATPLNRAILAEQVVVAEVVSADPRGRALNDGHRATVRFHVVDTLKGDARPGELLTVRLVSGFDADGTYQQENGEPILLPGLPGSLEAGDRYLLHLSRGQYANLARHAGYKPADPDWYALRQEANPVSAAGEIGRTYSDTAPAPTVAALHARLDPVQAVFERAGVD